MSKLESILYLKIAEHWVWRLSWGRIVGQTDVGATSSGEDYEQGNDGADAYADEATDTP